MNREAIQDTVDKVIKNVQSQYSGQDFSGMKDTHKIAYDIEMEDGEILELLEKEFGILFEPEERQGISDEQYIDILHQHTINPRDTRKKILEILAQNTKMKTSTILTTLLILNIVIFVLSYKIWSYSLTSQIVILVVVALLNGYLFAQLTSSGTTQKGSIDGEFAEILKSYEKIIENSR